jgi:Glycogen synthase
MEARGIVILYGRWLIEGAPRVLLIDTKSAYRFLDEWKADLWNTAGIPSPPGDDETNEAVVFGYLVAWFLGEVSTLGAQIVEKLTCLSSLHTKRPKPSSHTSTNGYPV